MDAAADAVDSQEERLGFRGYLRYLRLRYLTPVWVFRDWIQIPNGELSGPFRIVYFFGIRVAVIDE